MLYKLKEKWPHKGFVVLAVALLVLFTGLFLWILTFFYDAPLTPYREAYYFLIKGCYIPACAFALVDITISVVRRYRQEGDVGQVVREMTDLLIIAAVALVMMFQSPITFQRFWLVLCDVPNMIADNTQTIETDDFELEARDEKQETSKSTFHEYHYYAVINGQTYLVSKGLENQEFDRWVDDYVEDEMNGRPQELDAGSYEITYLPISKCILKIEFKKE